MGSGGTSEEEGVVVREAIIIRRVAQDVESERRTRQAENKGELVRARPSRRHDSEWLT